MAKKDEANIKAEKEAKEPKDTQDSKEAKGVAKTAENGGKPNLTAFLQGTKEELDKVVWPTRQQLVSESVAVILMVILSATLIYLIDNFFSWVAKQVF